MVHFWGVKVSNMGGKRYTHGGEMCQNRGGEMCYGQVIHNPFWPPSDPRGRPRRTDWRPKHFHTVCLGGTHPYQVLGPLNRPLGQSWAPEKGPFCPPKDPLGGL